MAELDILTARQKQIVKLVWNGLANKEIAESLGTTDNAVKKQLMLVFDLIGVFNRVELALWYERRRSIAS